MKIGELAGFAGVSVKALRVYENKNIKARMETNNKDNEIVKNSNIRNYYKQRIASVNKILDKSSKIVL